MPIEALKRSSFELKAADNEDSINSLTTRTTNIESTLQPDALADLMATKTSAYTPVGLTGTGNTTDDGDAIALAVQNNAGRIIRIPAGTYLMNVSNPINMPSDTVLWLDPGAIIKADTNVQTNYQMIRFLSVSNAHIAGYGKLIGDALDATKVSGGEWGMGIYFDNCTDCSARGIQSNEMWGDSVYIGGTVGPNRRIRISDMIMEKSRRNGISITNGEDIYIHDCTTNNMSGTDPQTGIDIEPNAGTPVKRVQVVNHHSSGNVRHGILVQGVAGLAEQISFIGGRSNNNGLTGFRLVDSETTTVVGTDLIDNGGHGIWMTRRVLGSIAPGQIRGNAGDGVRSECTTWRLDGGKITDNTGAGIRAKDALNGQIDGVYLDDNVAGNFISEGTATRTEIDNSRFRDTNGNAARHIEMQAVAGTIALTVRGTTFDQTKDINDPNERIEFPGYNEFQIQKSAKTAPFTAAPGFVYNVDISGQASTFDLGVTLTDGSRQGEPVSVYDETVSTTATRRIVITGLIEGVSSGQVIIDNTGSRYVKLEWVDSVFGWRIN